MTISAYRFRDAVAVHLPDCPTVYLDIEAARHLARALQDIGKDVKRCKFHQSEIRTTSIDTDATAKRAAVLISRREDS